MLAINGFYYELLKNNLASHLSRFSFGESLLISPYNCDILRSSNSSIKEFFSLRLVSPSRFIVSTNITPEAFELYNMTISAGAS